MKVKIEDKMARAKIGEGVAGAQRMRRAHAAVVENVRSDTERYTPKRSGNLRMSVDTSKGEEGLITWNAVDDKGRGYAAYVYRMPKSVHWTTAGTGPRWVERAANLGGIERWGKIAQEVLQHG